MMEAVSTHETSVNFYETTLWNNRKTVIFKTKHTHISITLVTSILITFLLNVIELI
jgi:hypothetical protein